jgi:hypothetical protein
MSQCALQTGSVPGFVKLRTGNNFRQPRSTAFLRKARQNQRRNLSTIAVDKSV